MLNEDEFITIVEAVEAAGGELIPETHVGYEIDYTINGPHGRKAKKPAMTTGCGTEALVEFDHVKQFMRGEDGKLVEMDDPAPTKARFCIVCDRLDLWPRFAKALEA